MKRIKGFAAVELVLVLVVVGIIAFVAYRVIQANGDVDTAQSQATQPTVSTEPAVPAANNAADLGTLENQLNNTNVDDDTSTQLDTQTSF